MRRSQFYPLAGRCSGGGGVGGHAESRTRRTNGTEQERVYFCAFSLVLHVHIQADAIFHPGGAAGTTLDRSRPKAARQAQPRRPCSGLLLTSSSSRTEEEIAFRNEASLPFIIACWRLPIKRRRRRDARVWLRENCGGTAVDWPEFLDAEDGYEPCELTARRVSSRTFWRTEKTASRTRMVFTPKNVN